MNSIIEKLGEAKTKLEAAEKEKIVIETQITGLLEQLEKLGFKDVADAKKELESMEEDISTLEDTLGEMLHDFEHRYATLLEGND